MRASLKVLLNTASLYSKMIITTIISLYLTRVVLDYLGVDDFGLYNLIGGVIALLSFVNSALMVSTQRYLSVAFGENNTDKIKIIFSSSVIIHLVLIVFLVLLFELCSLFLFDGFLNVNPNRISAAKYVYQIMILSTVFTVIGVPYNAIINAREDLWLFSIIETICAILKLGIIVIFQIVHSDALIIYSFWICIVTALNFILKYFWCKSKYIECRKLKLSIQGNGSLIKEMLSFSGWNAFGTLALVGRNQGVAIILNLFWGTAINAVYGIANQVNSQLIYFSTMLTTSMTPQIMKSYGEGNKSRMLNLSVLTCKLSFFLSAIFAIPLLLELPFVLKIWLKNVPEYTEVFCYLIIIMFLVMQLYPGLTRAIQATGKIKLYQLLTSLILLLPLPMGVIGGCCGYGSKLILYAMVGSQIIQMLIAIILTKKFAGLNTGQFFVTVVKSVIIFLLVFFLGRFLHDYISSLFSELVTFIIIVSGTMFTFAILYYCFVFDGMDRNRIMNVVKPLIIKIIR